ncbi:hypothetical protein AB4Y36_22165 [Paraburkholderia sp. BR10936]|uniref:hypothetical protein n=1 Tax=Paraburkholderia sp. BR10936 TaxID=3236993 RepID=UPI0034D26886
MTAAALAISLIGEVFGELFGPLSLPVDEPFFDRNTLTADSAASALGGNGRAAALVTAAGLDGADFSGDDYAGLVAVLEAAVALVERYELAAG